MAKPENTGQQKQHLVQDADGNQFQMTQAEWKARDKSAGLERVDDVEAEEPAEEPVTPEPVVPAQA